MPPDVYKGKPLNSFEDEFRLLEFQPLNEDQQAAHPEVKVNCILGKRSLKSTQLCYSALSCVRADPLLVGTEPILLDDTVVQVSRSLAPALEWFQTNHTWLKNGKDPFYLWVDVLCIRDDVHEKEEQVFNVGDIFSKADTVYAWLGTDTIIPVAFAMLKIAIKAEFDIDHPPARQYRHRDYEQRLSLPPPRQTSSEDSNGDRKKKSKEKKQSKEEKRREKKQSKEERRREKKDKKRGRSKSVTAPSNPDARRRSASPPPERMQQLLNAQAPHRAPAPGPLDCLRNYPELLLHPMTPETHPYLPVTQAISGWLAVEQLLQLDFWEDQWCFQEATMSSSRCLFFIGAGRALLNENTVKAGYEALEKILRLFRTTPRRPDFIPERDWRLLRAQYSKMKIPYLVQRFIAAKEQMVSAKERGCSTDKWVQRDARAQRAVLCVKLGFTHLAECSDRGDYYYSLGAIAGFKLHEFDVDYEGRPMVDICLLFWDAYLAATRDTPDALLFLHDALGPFGRREYDLPSWCPAYHHVEHQRLNREPFRRLRSRSWGATALGPECNLLNRYVPDSGSPLVHLRDQYLKVYGFVLGEVVGRSWRIGKNAVRNGLFRRYLLDYARRHGVYSREALPGGEAHRAAAKDLFATLMRDLDGEFEHQKGLDWLNIFEEGATFNQEDEKLWAEIRKAYAKALRRLSGIPLVRYLEAPPPRDVVKANLQKFLEDFSNTSRTCFFDTNGGIIGLGPEDMRVGDIACLIQGIQCPVILRPGMPIPKDPRPTWFPAPFAAVTRSRSLPPPDDGCGKGGFQFVGTCFLSGLMRGEAGARKPEHVKRHEEEFRGFRVY